MTYSIERSRLREQKEEEEVRQWLNDFGEGRWKLLPPREPKRRKVP